MNVPSDLKFTKEHEWIKDLGDGSFWVGITEYAQEQLGDIVYVELPEEGDEFKVKDNLSTVESVKAVSNIYAPFSCTVVECNETLEDEPELINSQPYETWIVKVNNCEVSDLLSSDEYRKYLESEK